jgi:hypothetical protein
MFTPNGVLFSALVYSDGGFCHTIHRELDEHRICDSATKLMS